jgi:glycolate oxidase FAD binding subunit
LTPRREVPTSYGEAADLLRESAEAGLRVRPVGGGTKRLSNTVSLSPGVEASRAPDAEACLEADVELSTAGLDRIVEHNAGDLTAILQAGVPLARAQEAFAAEGQMLALDPPDPGGATIGGIVASADSGPLRHRYGGVRDLVIGITVALSDGTIARSGGKVIKNVAGYDLAKLVAGSWGTLGVILEVAVRLHPIPRARATAVLEPANSDELGRRILELSHAPLELESLDVRREGRRGTVLARFAGVRALERAREIGGRVEDDGELWARQREAQRGAVRVSALQTDWPRLCRTADRAGGTLVGRAALGLAWFSGADETAVRAAFPERLPSHAEVELGRRVRARFDVHGALVG